MLALILSFSIALADQVVKLVVKTMLSPGHPVVVIPGLFQLTHIHNTGAAWGILSGQNTWLAVLSAVMLFVLVVWRRSFLSDGLSGRISLGLITGGIVGNMLDRVRYGYVVDFLDFHWAGEHHFPAFNIADAAICVGVGLVVLAQVLMARQGRQAQA